MIRTQVWLRKGLTGSEPAILELTDDRRIRLHLMDDDQLTCAFDAGVDETKVKWPVTQMSGGAHLSANGETVKVSFLKPNDALPAPPAMLQHVQKTPDGIGPGRANGKAFRQALGG